MRTITENDLHRIGGGMRATQHVLNDGGSLQTNLLPAPGGGDGGYLDDGSYLQDIYSSVGDGLMEGYIGDQTLDIYAQGYTEITNTTNTPETLTCQYQTNWGQLADGVLDQASGALMVIGAATADGTSWGTLTVPAAATIVVGYGLMLRGQNVIANARYKVCRTQ